jgi:hypothetical protein
MPDHSLSQKENLRRLVSALRELHRALINIAKEQYEREEGPVSGSGHFLQLLTKDPAFAWLHILSELMVDTDELLDEDVISVADAKAIRTQIETLLAAPLAGASEFSQKYSSALKDPAVIIAHAHVRLALTTIG